MRKDRFTDKVVIVTGASGAIGSVTVKKFAEEGAKIVLVDLNKEQLEQTAKKLELTEGNYAIEAVDITDEDAMAAMIDRVVATFGSLDVMFNNAGISGASERIHQFPTDSMKAVLNVNVMGTFLGTKYALAAMLKTGGGAIVNSSSIAGVRGNPDTIAYVASKHAIVGLTRATAVEYAKDGIRCCAVCPAPVNAPMIQRIEDEMVAMGREDRETIHKKIVEPIPMGRFAEPEEVANAVLFLASEDASFVSGNLLYVDGAMLSR